MSGGKRIHDLVPNAGPPPENASWNRRSFTRLLWLWIERAGRP